MIVESKGSDHRKFLCWTSTSKSYNASSHGIYEIIVFKHQSLFFGSFLTMKFFSSKFFIDAIWKSSQFLEVTFEPS
jgi:hypothetical protein